MFEVNYCMDAGGHQPAKECIDDLNPKMKAKVFGRIELLEANGSLLGMPFARHVEDGIWELRTPQGNDITRVLYFFTQGKKVWLTNGFVKKTQRTPPAEIKRAKKIRQDWRDKHE